MQAAGMCPADVPSQGAVLCGPIVENATEFVSLWLFLLEAPGSRCELIWPGSCSSLALWCLMMSVTPTRGCLLDLPWEDILVPHILCHLPLEQLLSLQRVSKSFQSLIQLYLANMRCFDSSQVLDGSEAGGGHRYPTALGLTEEYQCEEKKPLARKVVSAQELGLMVQVSNWTDGLKEERQ